MKEEMFYYGEDGKDVQGPLSLEAIRAAIQAGRLSQATLIAPHPNGPWKAPGVSKRKPKKKSEQQGKLSVCGFMQALGGVHLAAAIACLIMMFHGIVTEKVGFMTYGLLCMSNLLACLFVLGAAEVLVRLREIRDALLERD